MNKIKPYAKFAAALVTAGLIAAQQALPMSSPAHAWVTVALAVLGALAVREVPNAPLPPRETPPPRHEL